MSSQPSNKETFVNPTDDATFLSLKRLLAAPATSNQHLSLLTSTTLYGSITYYLSKLEIQHISDFAGVLSSSGCLWTPLPPSRLIQAPEPSDKAAKVAWSSESVPKSANAKDKPTPQYNTLSSFLISRSTSISQAVAAAVTRRAALLIESRGGSTGWATRRALLTYISSIIAGISAVEVESQPEAYKASRGLPISRMAIFTGLLQGLYLMKDQRRKRRSMSFLEEMAAVRANPSLKLSVKQATSQVEDEWIVTFAEILETLNGSPTMQAEGQSDESELDEWEKEFRKRTAELAASASITAMGSTSSRLAALREIQDVPLYLAARLAPFFPDKKLQALNTEQLANTAAEAVLSLFEGSSAVTSILSDLSTDTDVDSEDKVYLKSPSRTLDKVAAIPRTTLFSSLGPLSKLLSKALAREVEVKDPEFLALLLLEGQPANQAMPVLSRMAQLATSLEVAWLSSPLAGLEEDGIAPASRKDTIQLWTIFKSLLFSYTMIFDSMMDAIVEMCPSPTMTFPPTVTAVAKSDQTETRRWPPASTSNLPPAYIRIVQSMLKTFSHLYWITSTFGSDGFNVYQKVFYSALDVLGRDGEGCVALLEMIRPDSTPSSSLAVSRQSLEYNTARRSGTTYFLNVSEQLISILPDDVVEQMLLPICRPYLEDTRFKEAFESAHSVALASFVNRKRCMLDLAPFYVDLLTKSFPSLLNSTQLEYGFTTVISALSDRSDSVTWWSIERLAQEIEKERQTASAPESRADKIEASLETVTEPSHSDLTEASSDSSHPSDAAVASGGTGEKTAGQAISHNRYTSLQLCLIACVPCVNLVLLRSTLSKVEGYLLEHREREQIKGQDAKANKLALAEKTFDSIQGLNVATREEGLRWWLDKRASFGV